MLTTSADGHAGQCPAIPEEGAVGILLLSASRDHLLDNDLVFLDDLSGSSETVDKVYPGVGTPGLCTARVKEVLLDRGLDDHRAWYVDGGQVRYRAREPRSRYGNAKPLR